MAINLTKGQRIDLTKGNAGLTQIKVGLGWDEVSGQSGGGGFFKKLFATSGPSIDCDASVLMLDENDKLASKNDLIYYGNLKHASQSVQHMGDNLTGEGDGDDEVVVVNLAGVPAKVHKLVFVVNIYDCKSKGQDFGRIQNAFIRVVNNANNEELCKCNLTENYGGKTSLIVGEVYRHGSDWKFGALGEGTNDFTISEITNRYSR